ncbi:unnamed protein product [Prorocentrum cordatum]|uniref:Cellulase n=1 Tax=Prorocentrum cordatum TaxID=2364126 RepID=A0ABN9WSK9_9DINO|nr:unnamed protein product [Polarella glacialis]
MQVCSVHGKRRRVDCLAEDGAGGLCCIPGEECKQGGEGGASGACKWCELGECWTHGQMPKPGKDDASPKETCSVHGKQRSADCLEPDGAGGFRCMGGAECKMTGDWSGGGGKGKGKWDYMSCGKGQWDMWIAMMKGKGGCKGGGKACGKAGGKPGCKWCEQGECWTHGGKGAGKFSPF